MPQDVSAALSRVKSLLRSPAYWPSAGANVHEALDRVAASPEMIPVWEGLSRESPAPYLPELFLDACTITLMQWSRISKTPTGDIEKDVAQIAKTAKRLALLLRIHEADLSLRNTPTTVASLIRQRAQLAGQSGINEEAAIKAIQESMPSEVDAGGAIDTSLDIPLEHVLELLVQELRRPRLTELAIIRPTRINAANADRTFCCRELTRFFLTHGGEPHYEWVARSVTALLDLQDPLDATHVRHLFQDIEDYVWDAADDFGISVDDPSP
jgi:hypothetical protein